MSTCMNITSGSSHQICSLLLLFQIRWTNMAILITSWSTVYLKYVCRLQCRDCQIAIIDQPPLRTLPSLTPKRCTQKSRKNQWNHWLRLNQPQTTWLSPTPRMDYPRRAKNLGGRLKCQVLTTIWRSIYRSQLPPECSIARLVCQCVKNNHLKWKLIRLI